MNINEDISISREMLRSAKWNTAGLTVNYISLFINLIVLGRFVAPSDHGKAAIVFGIAAFFMLFSQVGFGNAIVAYQETGKRFVDTMFTLSLLLAVILYAVVFALSPLIADIYGDPIMTVLLRISALGVLFLLITAIPLLVIQRSLNYRGQAIVTISTAFINSICTLFLAISGFGIWALFFPSFIGNLIGMLVAFFVSRYRPWFAFDFTALKRAMNFGVSGLISSVSNFVCGNVVQVVMGKVWTSGTLGFYSFAEKQYSKPFDLIASQLTGSMFPIFSKISHDLQRMKAAYFKLTRLGIFLILPVYLALIIGAPYIFPFVFGNQWNFAIGLFQIFCLVAIIRTVCIGAGGILYSLKMPHLNAYIVLVRVASYLTAVFLFFKFKSDLYNVVKTVVAIDTFVILAYFIIALLKLKCSILEFVVSVLPSALLNLVFLIVSISLMKLFGNIIGKDIISFILAVFVAFGLYILLGHRYLSEEFKLIIEHIKKRDS